MSKVRPREGAPKLATSLMLSRQAETFHEKDWFESDASGHGTTGSLHTEAKDLAPISNLILDSMQDKGLPLHPDMFSSGKVAHGCGHSVRTVYKGIRTTGADFLHGHPSNLHILTETLVDKVSIEGEGESQRAIGVVAITQSGKSITISASKDIVISCGTYCTPTVLMRSGIGDREELTAAGIKVKSELSGVGKNLMDHLVGFPVLEYGQLLIHAQDCLHLL